MNNNLDINRASKAFYMDTNHLGEVSFSFGNELKMNMPSSLTSSEIIPRSVLPQVYQVFESISLNFKISNNLNFNRQRLSLNIQRNIM